jgi:hypothetical protein
MCVLSLVSNFAKIEQNRVFEKTGPSGNAKMKARAVLNKQNSYDSQVPAHNLATALYLKTVNFNFNSEIF